MHHSSDMEESSSPGPQPTVSPVDLRTRSPEPQNEDIIYSDSDTEMRVPPPHAVGPQLPPLMSGPHLSIMSRPEPPKRLCGLTAFSVTDILDPHKFTGRESREGSIGSPDLDRMCYEQSDDETDSKAGE